MAPRRSLRVAILFMALVFAGSSLWSGEPKVLIKTLKDSHTMTAGGGFKVIELIHPRNDGVDPGFSTAYVELGPRRSTKPHRLLTSSQVYYVLKGSAILHAGESTYKVKPGMAIYIAPGVFQWVENREDEPFAFICVVCPPWRAEDEQDLK